MKNMTIVTIVFAVLTTLALGLATPENTAQAEKPMAEKTMAEKPMMAKHEVSKAYLHSYNLPSSGVALEGYCPVAYFALNKPVKGSPKFASTHDGVNYHFISAKAQQAFKSNPEKFLPAYGGWCALGMAMNDKFPVDPHSFKIVNGKLFLFLKNKNVDALKLWNEADEQGNLQKAAAHWQKVTG